MRASPLCLVAALGAAALVAAGCGDDEIVNDGESPIDAGPPDGGADAENLCPGALTFEAWARNLVTGLNEFDVAVSEVADPSNTTTSAPNGRVVICLPDGADSELRAEKTDYLSRVDRVPGAVAALFSPDTIAYPLFVTSQADFEGLAADLAFDVDPGAAQVVVSVVLAADGAPLIGATVAIDKASDGAATRDEGGAFTAGDQIAAGDLVLFPNVPLAGGDVEITVTPPDGFRGTCSGPATLGLTAGEMSGALFACQ
jgi:hypothetical protein